MVLFLALAGSNGCLNNPCPSPSGFYGGIRLNVTLVAPLPPAQTVPSDIRQFILRLTFADDPSLTKTIDLALGQVNQVVDVPGLRPGKWELDLSGIDDAHDVIFHNNKDINVTIATGGNADVSASVSLAQGTFHIRYDASRIPGFGAQITRGKLSILHPDLKRTYPYLEMDGQNLNAEIPLDEGAYQIKLGVPDFGSKSAFISPVYPVTIRAGKTTFWNMAPDGTLK